MEAMAAGKVVVAADVPAIREVAGDAAVFVAPGDAHARDAARGIAQHAPRLTGREHGFTVDVGEHVERTTGQLERLRRPPPPAASDLPPALDAK